MADVGLKELLRAGVHFGHQTHRWNPKMRRYIFAERSGIYLLDLRKTLRQLERARGFVDDVVGSGGSVLFVCTKPQLSELVRSEAERCGAFYVTERWLGGMLTNFQTIKGNIRRLKELERGFEEGAFEFYTKKEQLQLDRERQKLERYLIGIKDMTSLPGLVYVVDANREEIAVKEAHRLGIPVVAIADTNADPELLTVPIPGNDDAIRSVSLITREIADAVERARREAPQIRETEEEGVYTYSSDVGETAEAESPRKKRRPRRRLRPEVIARRRRQREEEGERQPVAEDPGEVGEPEDEETPSAGEEADETAEEAAAEEPAAEEAAGEPAAEAEESRPEARSAEPAADGGDDEETGEAGDGSAEEVAVPAAAAAEEDEEEPDTA